MIRPLLLLLLFCPPFFHLRLVGAQPNSHAALEDFRERFPYANQLVQTQTNQHFCFEFEEKGIQKLANYSLHGEWQATLTRLSWQQLPLPSGPTSAKTAAAPFRSPIAWKAAIFLPPFT